MSNRIYSKNQAATRFTNLVNALQKLSNIVSAAKSVTCYALRTGKALTLATAIYFGSKKKEEASQPKDYAQPLRISGLKEIVGRLGNGSK